MTYRTLRVHAGVYEDLDAISKYLAEEAPDKIADFKRTYRGLRSKIRQRPLSRRILFASYRRAVMAPEFPHHMIIYTVNETTVDILAVLSTYRDPEFIEQSVMGRDGT